MYQLSFSIEEFLTHYWQKKPTIIKGGFSNFSDPLSPDELAGLTMEEEIDSRFVSNLDDNWVAEHGPFPEENSRSLLKPTGHLSFKLPIIGTQKRLNLLKHSMRCPTGCLTT